MTSRSTSPHFLLLSALALALAACPSDPPAGADCTNKVDCQAGEDCIDNKCVATTPTDDDGGAVDEDAGDVQPPEDGGNTTPGRDASAVISDPSNPLKDTDCDGLTDAEEFANTYHGGKTNPNDADSDDDGILDGIEVGRTSSVDAACTNFMGDADTTTVTSPLAPDSDGDGINDGIEDKNHNGRIDEGETDPNSSDSDGDGVTDGREDRNHNGVVDPGEMSPTLRDTDGDLIPDGIEDVDRDGVADPGETDGSKSDSDGDGCLDGVEDKNWNHTVDQGETNPLQAGDCGVAVSRDTDCDGIPDNDEATYGTNPNNPDTDGDGLKDGLELGVATNPDPANCTSFQPDLDRNTRTNPLRADSDCDGLKDGAEDANHNGRAEATETDPSKPDTDGDGLLDGVESGVCQNPDPANCTHFVADADCSATTLPLDPDSDNDGIADGAEDSNQNGRHDSGELDPLNGTDGNGPAQQACSTENLRPVTIHESVPADVRLAATADFTEVTRPRASGAEKGVMVYDPTHKVVGIALLVTPTGAGVAADETAGRGKLSQLGTVSNAISQTFTTWDGYPAAHAFYDLAGNTDLKTRANDIVGKFIGTATDLLAGTAGVDGPFKIEAEYVRRSANRTVVVLAVMPESKYDENRPHFLSDVGGGSALAQFGDTNAVQCEVFQTQPPPKVDFVWVVDNSGSMLGYQKAVAAAGATMIAKLQNAAIDWRMAATTSSFYLSNQDPEDGFRPFTTNLTTITNWFTSGRTDWFGTSGSGNERLLASAQKATTTVLLNSASPTETRLRAGATLVFILLGDADDQSGTNAAGYATFFQDYDAQATGAQRAQVHGIVCPDGQNCGGEAQTTPLHKNKAVIDAMGGIFGDINEINNGGTFEATVEAIINASVAGASPYTTSKPPIASTIKLAIDSTALAAGSTCTATDLPRQRQNGFDFDGVTRRVLFYGDCRPAVANKPTAISYRYWNDLTSNPNGQPDPCGGPCAAPLVCDATLNKCVCPSDCGAASPGATYMCEPTSCKWVCSPDCNGCGANELCDTASCQCECNENMTCGPGFRFDTAACGCVCNTEALACTGNLQLDEALCGCVCPADCGGKCQGNTRCNQSTCQCVGGIN